MLYHFFDWLNKNDVHIPGGGLFQYITFRVLLAILFALIISAVIGRKIIDFLRKKQIGETVRDLGLQGEEQKKGTPTMGGIIILLAILIPTLLFANLNKVYVRLMILSTVWLGIIGFLDDYFKLRSKRLAKQKGTNYKKSDSDGLAARSKLIGQIGLGLIVGTTLYINNSVVVYREVYSKDGNHIADTVIRKGEKKVGDTVLTFNGRSREYAIVKTPITTIPFVKNHEFNYAKLISWTGLKEDVYTWLLYIIIVTFIITAVSNGANITDGLDGLATGVSAIIGAMLGIFAYVSGNVFFADYLNVMYIPNMGELTVFIAAFVGACIGFLWYNAYPAQVFMGDTGSLALGGIIASLAIIVRKELLIPIFCGVFFIELLSVMIQVSYFKYTKKKYGEGRRVFLMSPLHHHFQKQGFHESKIAVRFWIITMLLIVFSILSLKIR